MVSNCDSKDKDLKYISKISVSSSMRETTAFVIQTRDMRTPSYTPNRDSQQNWQLSLFCLQCDTYLIKKSYSQNS